MGSLDTVPACCEPCPQRDRCLHGCPLLREHEGRLAALEARVAEWGALVEEHEAYFAPLKARVLEADRPAPPASSMGVAEMAEVLDPNSPLWKPAPPAAPAHKMKECGELQLHAEHDWEWGLTTIYHCPGKEPAPQAAAAVHACLSPLVCEHCDHQRCGDGKGPICSRSNGYHKWQPRQGGRP